MSDPVAPSGQTGERPGRVPPADGAVPGAAGPRSQDRLPAEAAAGGPGLHQSPDITAVHGAYSNMVYTGWVSTCTVWRCL